jgi:hypothetical protein
MIFNSSRDKKLIDVKETEEDMTLCLAAAHALIRLDDGTIVNDPMEKMTLEALEWNLSKGRIRCKISTGPPLMFKRETQSPHRPIVRYIAPSYSPDDTSSIPVLICAQTNVDRLFPTCGEWAIASHGRLLVPMDFSWLNNLLWVDWIA